MWDVAVGTLERDGSWRSATDTFVMAYSEPSKAKSLTVKGGHEDEDMDMDEEDEEDEEADILVDFYIDGWKQKKVASFVVDGNRYHPELVEEFSKGRGQGPREMLAR